MHPEAEEKEAEDLCDRWEVLLENTEKHHQRQVAGELLHVMRRQTEKIKELRASKVVATSTKGRDKKRQRHDFGYRPKQKKGAGGKAEQMPPPAKI